MDRNETRLHERPVEPPAGDQSAQAAASGATASGAGVPGSPGAATQAPARPAAPQPRSGPSQPIGEFHPPAARSQRGLASRSWVPVALSFGTALLVAIALVIYFSQHT